MSFTTLVRGTPVESGNSDSRKSGFIRASVENSFRLGQYRLPRVVCEANIFSSIKQHQ